MTTAAPAASPDVRRVHVARQGIYDTSGSPIGYELLFRRHATSSTSGVDGAAVDADAATTAVILATFTSFGLRQLVGEGLAFVNLTRPFFVDEAAVPFVPGSTVLEILESFPMDPEVVAGVRRLRAQGFAVALDDFLWEQTDRIELLDDVTHVKIDISQVPNDELPRTVRRLREHDVVLVAERIETAEDLERCRELGFELFQGFHLLKPETLSTAALQPNALTCLDLLSRLADPELSFDDLEELVLRDGALTVRVLQAANAAAAGGRRHRSSARDALVMLGFDRLKAWVMLIVASDAGGEDKTRLSEAVVRARTCELLADGWTVKPDVAFTAGLISRLDIVLGLDAEVVIDRLGLSGELREALVGRTGPLGRLVAAVESYAAGPVAEDCTDGDLCHRLAEAHVEAIAWATRTVGRA